MTATTIRKARRSDSDALARLLCEADELHARLMPGYFRRPTRPTRARDQLERILDAIDQGLYVAEDPEAGVCGLVHVQLYDTPAIASMVPKRRAHIDNLVVTEGMRRRGLGRRLVEAAIAWAREQGAAEILLTVWAGNEAAERFYDALGFARVSTVLGKTLD